MMMTMIFGRSYNANGTVRAATTNTTFVVGSTNMLSKGLIKQGLGAVVGTRVQLVIRQYTYSDISFYDVGGRVNT